MLKSTPRRAAIFGGAAAVFAILAGGCAPPPPPLIPVTIYDSNPSPLPGNVSSQGFECCQVAEFGDQVAFAAATPRHLQQATVTMSSWATKASWPTIGDAVGFDHPLTLNIYSVGPIVAGNPTLGTLLGSFPKLVHVPYRKAADPINCATTPAHPERNGTQWTADGGVTCFNGQAFQVTFDLSGLGVAVPDQIVWGVAYNTSEFGVTPLRPSAPAGGPYDSLNVGAEGAGASVGTDVNGDVAWLSGGNYPYCDGGAGNTGALRPDVGCAPGAGWTGYTPEISFTAL